MVLWGKEFRLFYFTDAVGDLQGARNGKRTFALLTPDTKKPGEYMTYLFPEEQLSADRFKEFAVGDKKIKLRLKDAHIELKISR